MAARGGRKKKGGRAAGPSRGSGAGEAAGGGKDRNDQKGTNQKRTASLRSNKRGRIPPGADQKGTVPPGAKEDIPPMGTAARLAGMLVNPVRTLEDIIRRPRVLTAASLLLATNVLFVLLIWDKIQVHAHWLVEHAPPPGVPAEEMARFAALAPGVAATNALLGPVITWFMIVLLFRIIASGTGRAVTFGLLFNLVVFGMVPYVLGLYLDSVVRFFADPQRADYLQLSISAAYLVPGGVDAKWFPLLNAVNPFTIWGLALASIGGAKLLGVRVARVAVPLLGLWFLLALLRSFSPAAAG